MRKALLVSVLLALAACSVDPGAGDDSSNPPSDPATPGGAIDRSAPTLPGVGDGEEATRKLMWENASRFLRLTSTPWTAT